MTLLELDDNEFTLGSKREQKKKKKKEMAYQNNSSSTHRHKKPKTEHTAFHQPNVYNLRQFLFCLALFSTLAAPRSTLCKRKRKKGNQIIM